MGVAGRRCVAVHHRALAGQVLLVASRLPRKWDPQALEKEFVTTDITIRELARRHEVSWSTVASWARKEDWKGKRVAYKSALSRRGYESMAVEVASQEGLVRDESVTVMRATLRVYAQQLASGEIKVTTRDAVEAVRTLATLLQEPEGPKDGNVIEVGPPADADFLRRVVEAARRRLAAPGVLEGPAAAGAEKPRLN